MASFYSLPDIIEPSSVNDLEFISYLYSTYRSVKAALKSDRLDVLALAEVPGFLAGVPLGKLPSCFLMRHASAAMEGWKTDHGNWLPKKLVSISNTFQGNSPNSPKFVGAKATLEFKPTGGTKAVLGMTRYNILTPREDGGGLYLDEDLALCHVFPLEGKGKGTLFPYPARNRNGKRPHAPDQCNDSVLPELDEWDQGLSELDMTKYSPLGVEDYHVDVPRLESKHWHNFTKIYTKNPKLMYAACNHCNTMLKLTGGTSCGTGSLNHHNVRCKPKQEQLRPATLH